MGIDNLITDIENEGSVLNFNEFCEMKHFDELIDYISKKSIGNEKIIFCSRKIHDLILNMLPSVDETSVGVFKPNMSGGMKYIVDLSLNRGNYNFYIIIKDMEGAVLCSANSNLEESEFIRGSIRLNIE
jgi:hypothetical protein